MSQKVTVTSEKQPLKGQNARSSNNFISTVFPEKARLTFKAYYDYGMPTQSEAKDIVFDIKADSTGKDPVYLEKIRSGHVANNTHHRNLYIANPRSANSSFTVEIGEDFMKKVKICCGGYTFEGILEVEKAPETCAAFVKLLPLREKVIHVRWSGEAFWIPYGDRHAQIPYENNTSYPSKGEALWYPGGPSEAEIIFAYGCCCFSSKIGQLAGNHFLSVKDNLDDWYELGRKILCEGKQDLTIELT